MAWPSDVVNGAFINASDINAAYAAVRNWGGNVDAGGNALSNALSVTAQSLTADTPAGGGQAALNFRATSGGIAGKQRSRLIWDNGTSTLGSWVFQSLTDAGVYQANVLQITADGSLAVGLNNLGQFGGASGVISIANATVAPSSGTPTPNGVLIWAAGGHAYVRNAAGVTFQLDK